MTLVTVGFCVLALIAMTAVVTIIALVKDIRRDEQDNRMEE